MSYHPKTKSLIQRLRDSLERNGLQEPYAEAEHAIAGECQDMCPVKEQKERERQRRLHILEVVEGTERDRRPTVDHSLAIKEYSRPAAGKEEANPSDLRPPHVLLKVVNHIVQKVLTRNDLPWFKIYNFAFDRLRAVRQDLVIQRASGFECALILEQCVRFHIYSAYRLCAGPLTEFDPKINSDHTRECLKRLLYIYKLQQQEENGERDKTQQDAQIQMESCHVIFSLGTFDALLHVLSLPKDIRLSPRLVNAVALTNAFWEGNFIRVKKLAARLSAIEMCCLHTHLQHMRSQALMTMNTAFSSRNLLFPTRVLTDWLMFDEVEEAEDFCHHYGLEVKDEKVAFSKSCSLQDYKLPPKRPWCTYVNCQLESLTIPDIIKGAVRCNVVTNNSKRKRSKMDIVPVFVWLLSCIGIAPLEPSTSDGLVDHRSVDDLVNGNILDVLRQAGATTFLSYAERCPWVLRELGGRPGYTVLAPTNNAFEKIPKIIYDAMNSSAQVTEWYLRYHIVPGVIPRSGMRNNRLVPTAFKPPQSMNEPVQMMRFNTYTVWNDMLSDHEKVVTASGSPIVKVDLTASNGVVHIIDRVIYPIPTGSDMAKYLEIEPSFSSLYAALETANLTLALSTPAFKPLTLLAPSNAAFEKLSKAQQDLLKNTTILQQVLTYHVVGGSYYSAAIYEDFQLHSLEGSIIYFQKGAGGTSAGGRMVVKVDTTVTNGVVHELDGVMFPPSLNHLLSNDV